MLRVESGMGDILGTNIRSNEGRGDSNKFGNNSEWLIPSQKQTSRKRSQSFDSSESNLNSNDEFGWFDDIESNVLTANGSHNEYRNGSRPGKMNTFKTLSLPLPASNPPTYVLESTIETQHLWYETAGQRPQQPRHEREYFESLWKRNFENSSVDYAYPNSEVDSSSEDENLRVDTSDGVITQRGRGPFSIAVSKSFLNQNISCVTLQMPSFRVIRSNNGTQFAEFLVVVTFSNIQSLSLGIWRRHSHFADLVYQINAMPDGAVTYRNTLLSWQCLLNRKRWFKCLDQEYLSLKCFLLERFMHDLLFESPIPNFISEFLGLEN